MERVVHLALGAWFRLVGLAATCRGGCGSAEFHTAHLRRGALTYLGGAP